MHSIISLYLLMALTSHRLHNLNEIIKWNNGDWCVASSNQLSLLATDSQTIPFAVNRIWFTKKQKNVCEHANHFVITHTDIKYVIVACIFFSFILLNHDHDLNSWLFRITCISQLNIFVNLMLFFGLLDLADAKNAYCFDVASPGPYTVPVQLANTNKYTINFILCKEKPKTHANSVNSC